MSIDEDNELLVVGAPYAEDNGLSEVTFCFSATAAIGSAQWGKRPTFCANDCLSCTLPQPKLYVGVVRMGKPAAMLTSVLNHITSSSAQGQLKVFVLQSASGGRFIRASVLGSGGKIVFRKQRLQARRDTTV